MRRVFRQLLAALCLLPALAAYAQAGVSPDAAAGITFGQSAIAVNGPWKFHAGDSPVDPQSKAPLWAQPGFQDADWQSVDLTPREGSMDPTGGQAGYVPGWETYGHKGYWGYGWYRVHLRLAGALGEKLALK